MTATAAFRSTAIFSCLVLVSLRPIRSPRTAAFIRDNLFNDILRDIDKGNGKLASVDPPNMSWSCQEQAFVFGDCISNVYRWTYLQNGQNGTGCREFAYSGCGGNLNNFETKVQCMELCEGVRETRAAAGLPFANLYCLIRVVVCSLATSYIL